MSVRETATRERYGWGERPEGSDYSKALPLVGCATEQEARQVVVRYGAQAYPDTWAEGNYMLSLPEFDGTVDGVFAAAERIERDLNDR